MRYMTLTFYCSTRTRGQPLPAILLVLLIFASHMTYFHSRWVDVRLTVFSIFSSTADIFHSVGLQLRPVRFVSLTKIINIQIDCVVGMRFAVPLGLNVSSSMSEFSRSLTRKTILPPPTDPAEQEARRNLFWMCFLQDR